jgi:transposase
MRRKEALDAFFAELDEEKCARSPVCVLDTWDRYIAPVHEHTHVGIDSGLFHVAKKIAKALDTVRKQGLAKADAATRKKFKKKQFLILKRGERRDETSRETLLALTLENERLCRAHRLKEQARGIFEERDEDIALQLLEWWFANVKDANVAPFNAVVKTLTSYLDGIVSYSRHRPPMPRTKPSTPSRDQYHQTESLQLSRSRVFQAEDPPPSIWEVILKERIAFIRILVLLKSSNI